MSNNAIKNFKYLNELIHSGAKEIVLDSDIVLGDDEESQYLEGIELDVDDLAIDGNGHTIDARGKARIFECIGKNVIIKNIILKNGFVKGYGGAIHNRGNLKITESTLSNNTAKDFYGKGGAIHNEHGELRITKSTLSNNTVKGHDTDGGAIYNEGILTISWSTLNNNSAKSFGGGIFSRGSLTITSSTFTDNTSSWGTAIRDTGMLTIIDSTFIRNSLRCELVADIKESIFMENYQSIDNDGGNLTIIGSTFTNNERAIQNRGGTISIINSDFTDNASKSEIIENRGNSEMYSKMGKITMNGTKFINNKSKNIIRNRRGKIKIIRSEFENNFSTDSLLCNDSDSLFNNNLSLDESILNNNNGKHIFKNESELNISFCKIRGSEVEKSAILNNGIECSIAKTKLENNISKNSTIIDNQTKLTINKPKIKGCVGKIILNRGIIFISPIEIEEIVDNLGTIKLFSKFDDKYQSFTNLEELIRTNGEKITLENDYVFKEHEIDYFEGGIELDMDNLVIDGNGHCIDANNFSRIFIVMGNVTMKNITFRNGRTFENFDESKNSNGAAIRIYPNGKLNMENCTFINNYSSRNGGVIDNHGTMTISDCTLNDNSSKRKGGAISNRDTMMICNSTLNDNTSKQNGGAINNEDGELTVINCIFNKNVSEAWPYGGGAISNNFKLDVTASTFANNKANHYGGAINNAGQTTIRDSVFKKNGTDNRGGAIDNYGTMTIRDTQLTDNYANDGGAVSNMRNSDLSIHSSILQRNQVKGFFGYGGAIKNVDNGKLRIMDSIIINNKARRFFGRFGGIYTEKKGFVEMKNCRILNNEPKSSYILENLLCWILIGCFIIFCLLWINVNYLITKIFLWFVLIFCVYYLWTRNI